MIHLLWFKMKLNYVQINVSNILFVFSMAFNIVFIYSATADNSTLHIAYRFISVL